MTTVTVDGGSGSVPTLATFVRTHGRGLSPQLQRVLALLVLSCDDDTIGFVLHIRHSTVRHYIDHVLTSMQMTSRHDVALLYVSSIAPCVNESLAALFEETSRQRVAKILRHRSRGGG